MVNWIDCCKERSEECKVWNSSVVRCWECSELFRFEFITVIISVCAQLGTSYSLVWLLVCAATIKNYISKRKRAVRECGNLVIIICPFTVIPCVHTVYHGTTYVYVYEHMLIYYVFMFLCSYLHVEGDLLSIRKWTVILKT